MYSSPLPCYTPKYLPEHPILEHPSSLNVRDEVSTHTKQRAKLLPALQSTSFQICS